MNEEEKNSIFQGKKFTRKERAQIWKEYCSSPQDIRLRNRVIEANMALVISLIFQQRCQLSFEQRREAISVGVLGLERALEKFDHTKGCKFSTYATRWVRKWLQVFMATLGMIPLNAGEYEDYLRARRFINAVQMDSEDVPTDFEIAQGLGITLSQVKKAQQIYATRQVLSFSDPVPGTHGDLTIGDAIADRELTASDVFEFSGSRIFTVIDAEKVTHAIPEDKVAEALSSLLPRERLVLLDRMVEGRTLESLGLELGCTREWVRQIHKKAIKKLCGYLGIDPPEEKPKKEPGRPNRPKTTRNE